MIYGVGIDIVQVSRIRAGLDRFGERFARRVLGDEEYAIFRATKRKPHFLAKCFAAKEAMSKALGTGLRHGVYLRDIVVVHDGFGKPHLVCAGYAGALLETHGISGSHLSLADEEEYAVAMVMLEKP